jgi:hypothetical protein
MIQLDITRLQSGQAMGWLTTIVETMSIFWVLLTYRHSISIRKLNGATGHNCQQGLWRERMGWESIRLLSQQGPTATNWTRDSAVRRFSHTLDTDTTMKTKLPQQDNLTTGHLPLIILTPDYYYFIVFSHPIYPGPRFLLWYRYAFAINYYCAPGPPPQKFCEEFPPSFFRSFTWCMRDHE